jgi:integrase
MRKERLTIPVVENATPEAKDYVIWDSDQAGFGCKVTPTGRKVYFYRYRIAPAGAAAFTPPRKYTIGKHGGSMTPERARKRAKALAGDVAKGIDPKALEDSEKASSAEKSRLAADQARIEKEQVFEKVANLWLEHYENEWTKKRRQRRPATVRLARTALRNYLLPKLAEMPVPHIKRKDLQAVLDGIPHSKPAMLRAVYRCACVLFEWARKRDYLPENPLTGIDEPGAPESRDRVLSDSELAVVWNASEALRSPLGAFFRVLILTGKRRAEVARAEWGEFDRAAATWHVPVARAKNHTEHIVPLVPAVVAELDRLAGGKTWPKIGYVFRGRGGGPLSGHADAKAAMDAQIAKVAGGDPVAPWRTHDLRRTAVTGWQKLGVGLEVAKALLNHSSGREMGATATYARHNWAAEKRAALEVWARHVATLDQPRGPNVVSFHKEAAA